MKKLSLVSKDLFKSFLQAEKELEVLSGINIKFEQGKTYAITGASGSGKSTFIHILGGLDKPSSGSIFIGTTDISSLNQKEKEKFLSEQLGFVFQFHYLIKELSVLENIILPALILGKSKFSSIQKAKKMLKNMDLLDKADSYPTELSGGQLQRVSILRAIFNEPAFLIADEPTGDLDASNAQIITDILLECKEKWGMGLIICTHDKTVYKRMDNILILKNGILK